MKKSKAFRAHIPRSEMHTATRKKTCVVKQTHLEEYPILMKKTHRGEKIINNMENTTLRVFDDEPKTFIKKGIAELWKRCGVYTFVHYDDLRAKLEKAKVPAKYWKYLNESCQAEEAKKLEREYKHAESELEQQIQVL
jgi:hypothetical protein